MAISSHAESVRSRLAGGPLSARQLVDLLGTSQPTLSRALAELEDEVVRIGAARSIHYALLDRTRGFPDFPVFRVDAAGRVQAIGQLYPVRPEGYVMRAADGATSHSDGLPWWLMDMRPQGYLGRAFAARHAADLGLPARLTDWSDSHALRALLAQGQDFIGDLLLGERARARFLAEPPLTPLAEADKPAAYVRLAREAAEGGAPGSSAGGEQPKFCVYADTPAGPRQLLVKFSEAQDSPVSERWRDLLLAEHLAAQTLREAGLAAVETRLLDHAGQRFLEVARFDRIGAEGRRGVVSLAALDAEFLGMGAGTWPEMTRRLAREKAIRAEDADAAGLLWAYGSLIGNSDMHSGNLSFFSEQGSPCEPAPAYDMTCMAFAPRSGGGLPDSLPAADLAASVSNAAWHRALALAENFLQRLREQQGFSRRFAPCLAALENHITTAGERIARLG